MRLPMVKMYYGNSSFLGYNVGFVWHSHSLHCEIIIIRGVLISMDFVVHLNHKN